METTVSFGYWIRRQRKALDLTQQVLADRVGCSVAAIKKIEQDERRPSRQIAERMAQVLGIASDRREIFLEVARGLRSVDQLPLAHGAASALPSGTVTFLFTDIEGSTKLARQYPQTWESLRARHHAILREAITAKNGYVFQVVGDAFCAAFHNANDGILAAIDAQRKLQTENWGEAPIRVRMGLHTGEAELHEDEYHGYVTLNLVERVVSAGHGGQILISQATEILLRGESFEGVSLRDLGEYNLKGAAYPVHIFQVLAPDLPKEFPTLGALEVFPNNLPTQLTSFIGRGEERAEAKRLLSETHLLTLVGSGGTGKTRLALQIGAELIEHFRNGVWLVDLAPITDPAFIIQTAMAAFGITAERHRPAIDTLKDYLHAKSLLLILDNCEHMVEDCARFTEFILQAAPKVRILATSREALDIMGEQVYFVPSLSTPQSRQLTTSEDLTQYEAVQLFIERAALISPNFHLTKENASSIAQICSRLDGIPLAIELAAARSRSMPVEQIASHIDDRFRLLTGGSRTALPRHQTLRSLIDGSYDLLTETERILLRRLAVFKGGWTLEAAEIACAGESIDAFVVMDLLSNLVDKSLVLLEKNGRYKFLETIRQYAHEKLLESGEMHAIREKHLAYFLDLTERKGTETLGANQIVALKFLDQEYENIREAIDWAIESGQVEEATQIGNALFPLYWWSRALFQEAYEKMMLILNHPATTKEKLFRAQALVFAVFYAEAAFVDWDPQQTKAMMEEAIEIAGFAGVKGSYYLWMAYGIWGYFMIGKDTAGAEKALDMGLAIARKLNNKIAIANTLQWQGLLAVEQKDYSRAQEFANEAIGLFREMGEHWGLARSLGVIGSVFYWQGDYAEAQRYFEEALAICRNLATRPNLIEVLGHLGQISALTAKYAQAEELLQERLFFEKDSGWAPDIEVCTTDLAYLHLYEGNPAPALALFRESLSLFENADKVRIAVGILGIASALFQSSPQNAEYAAQLLGSVQSVIDTIGIESLPYEKEQIMKTWIAVQDRLGEVNFEKCSSRGKAMTFDAAIALAQKVTDEQLANLR